MSRLSIILGVYPLYCHKRQKGIKMSVFVRQGKHCFKGSVAKLYKIELS